MYLRRVVIVVQTVALTKTGASAFQQLAVLLS
jgi:hypothetical protein